MGRGLSPLNSHSQLVQTTRSSRGVSSFGCKEKPSGANRRRHQGQLSNGIGGGLTSGFALNRRVLARAVSERWSFFRPMRLGVAALPTHRPISNGQLPYRAASFWRSSSKAQTSPAARESWSNVRRRSVYRMMTLTPAPSRPSVPELRNRRSVIASAAKPK